MKLFLRIKVKFMLDLAIRDKLLVDELQLGDSLNNALHENNRAYFDLLLSLVSNDVTDDAAVVDPKRENLNNKNLRQMFNLQEREDHIYTTNDDFVRGEVIGTLVANNDMAALHLILAMNKEPLALFSNERLNEVLTNVSPLTRAKTELLTEGEHITHRPYDLTSLAIVEAIDKARDFIGEVRA